MPMIAPAAEWEMLVQKMKIEMPEAFASDGGNLGLGATMNPRWTAVAWVVFP